MTTATALEEEARYFYSHRAELLRQFENRYVLIRGSQVVGSFDDFWSAVDAGFDRFGPTPFLAKKVLRQDPHLFFPFDLGPGLNVTV
jgi:hypothetical protein